MRGILADRAGTASLRGRSQRRSTGGDFLLSRCFQAAAAAKKEGWRGALWPLDQVHVISLDPVDVLLPCVEAFPGFGRVWIGFRQQVDAIEDEGGGDVFAGGCGRGAGALEFVGDLDDAGDGPGQGLVHEVFSCWA